MANNIKEGDFSQEKYNFKLEIKLDVIKEAI